MAQGDEEKKVWDMDPPKEDGAPSQWQQRLGRWGIGAPTEAGGIGEVGVCAGDRSDGDVQ